MIYTKFIIVRDSENDDNGLAESLISSEMTRNDDLTVFSERPDLESIMKLVYDHAIARVIIEPINSKDILSFFDDFTSYAQEKGAFQQLDLQVYVYDPTAPSSSSQNSIKDGGGNYATTENQLFSMLGAYAA